MKIITYSLKNTDKKSDRFFEELSEYTDLVIQQAEDRFTNLIAAFQDWAAAKGVELPRTFAEYAFDLLVIGVLWQVHGREMGQTSPRSQKVLATLSVLRKQMSPLKPVIDLMRGLIGGVSLHTGREDGQQTPLTTDGLHDLITWLSASGDFKEEVRRLEIWALFFAENSIYTKYYAIIIEYAKYFNKTSLESLGPYTPNVDKFLTETHPAYRWREDFIFTGRQRVEYHLYLVGMEIMNRSFREAFLESEHKIIFVPPCMAAPADGKCQSVDTPYGARCANCTPGCQVNQITSYGEKHGIQVFMIPDSFSPLDRDGDNGAKPNKLGVVGVSCPLTIVSGGYEMKRLGIPAQGVPLDHCGCSWHWDPGKGIVTEVNLKKLIEIVEK